MFRINNNFLVKLVNPENNRDFYKLSLVDTTKQYVDVQPLDVNNDVNNLVFAEDLVDGSLEDVYHRLNKTYSGTLFEPSVTELLQYRELHVLVKQHTNWENVFGFLLVVKDIVTNNTLVSKMLTINDFKITGNKELINGTFFLESSIINVPLISTVNMLCQIETITYSDIVSSGLNIGLVYNYPIEFETLIQTKPIPDFITLSATLNSNHYLALQLNTTENKTLEKSILDYFGVSNAVVKINYSITYGTEALGYSKINVTNEVNKFNPLNIGLDLLYFYLLLVNEENKLVNLYVDANIEVDGKLMVRTSELTTDFNTINPLISNAITHPTTNFPVTINNETVINQQVINTPERLKVLTISEPKYIQFISNELKIENKLITFEYLKVPAFLSIGEKILIKSLKTADEKYYFDLTKIDLSLLTNDIKEYSLIDETQLLIGRGKII